MEEAIGKTISESLRNAFLLSEVRSAPVFKSVNFMQTFLTSSSFEKTAKCLDYRRLGCQRIEAYLALKTILGLSKGWKNHVIVRIWKNYPWALAEYGKDICLEWINRGYKDSMYVRFNDLLNYAERMGIKDNFLVYPGFIFDERFLSSHRSALLAKNYQWYQQWQWKEEPKIEYFWPEIK